ncbi:unknown [Clostridium sp. CAG:768]|jgi:hypothetical protein|uniref:hypothetical protein n=1 Tax=Candidatus Stercorousia sp. TaxID=3048886 RepID=UPI0003370E99|nr:unknown [Clostridium sp. CAG:768]
MDKNLKSILKVTAYAGIMTAGIIAFLVYMAKQRKKDMKNRMILIARQIDADIVNTQRKISPRYHEKNQRKYDELWGNGNLNN